MKFVLHFVINLTTHLYVTVHKQNNIVLVCQNQLLTSKPVTQYFVYIVAQLLLSHLTAQG